MIKLDYKNRPVVYFGNNIAIIKDTENCYIVVTALFIDYDTKLLNFNGVKFFARTKEEAEEVVRKIVQNPNGDYWDKEEK